MKNIRFDEQPFQLSAINAIADIFDGQYAADSQKLFEIQAKFAQDDSLLAGLTQDFTIRGNSIQVSDEMLVKNIRDIQERNGIESPSAAESFKHGRNYTIEMETGTGKTYVYVRTALELARRYGWRKFMIVVPSIAIKEGVANAIETMRGHLESIYDDVGYFNASIYNSKNTGAIGEYARSEDVELLITTIDSFKRQDTHMNREQEDLGWQKPIDVLASVQPIVIIDEPQSNMGVAGKVAIERINALFTLRYSATHRRGEYYNLMYQLSPVDAHKENLVKTVYVRSAGLDGAASKPYVKLLDIRTRPTGAPEAKIEIDKRINGIIQKKQQWVKDNTDLEMLTENDAYRGYVLDGISAREGSEHISFEGSSNDLYKGDSIGGFDDQVMRAQIRSTIAAHLEREKNLNDKGIKVLSLFFVDKVASYWEVDDAGIYSPGKIQRWFVEELKEQLNNDRYKSLYSDFEISQLYDAYFSVLRKKKANIEQFIDEDSASSADYKAAEAEAFERIMKDKKGLLDINKPLRFIFSHSALKEGWDNPNVFQICMMRDANSPMDRRQTIGRGLRLPVALVGDDYVRSFDKTINQLTVVANESYEEFAANLQKEYVSEGVVFGKIRSNAFAKIIDVELDKEIGFEKSKLIWQNLVDNGFVSASGELTAKFTPGVLGFDLDLPDHLKNYDKEVQDAMQDYQLKNIVKEDKPVRVKYSKQILRNNDFNELWDKINQKTTYRVDFSTEELIDRATELVANMPRIMPVRVVMKEGKLQYTQGGIDGQDVAGQRTMSVVDVVEVPDIISFLQRETSLTRQTLADILIKSGRLGDLLINPTEFKFTVLTKIREVTQSVQIEKISYSIVPGRSTMSQRKLEEQLEQEVIRQLDKIYKVQQASKLNSDGDELARTLSDHIPIDSNVEFSFARKLDMDPNVEVFVKLPGEYKIPTPFGNYNPDWAYVYNLNGEKKLHLVRETKHTLDQQELQRETEKAKVACARVHYSSIDVDYELATDTSPLIRDIF
jgi:type III restriction enzyme